MGPLLVNVLTLARTSTATKTLSVPLPSSRLRARPPKSLWIAPSATTRTLSGNNARQAIKFGNEAPCGRYNFSLIVVDAGTPRARGREEKLQKAIRVQCSWVSVVRCQFRQGDLLQDVVNLRDPLSMPMPSPSLLSSSSSCALIYGRELPLLALARQTHTGGYSARNRKIGE